MELELYDNLRKAFKVNFGDIAIANAWKVSKHSATQLLVSPGEAWINGLIYELRPGNDWLISSATVSSGLIPNGVTISDATDGSGKLITFAPGTVSSDKYRVVITASEQIIDFTKDPFLQNANITEPTASKVRLVYTINVVLDSNQGSGAKYDTVSYVPYQGDNTSPYTLANTVEVNPQVGGSPARGCLASGSQAPIVQLSSGQIIDGRTLELTVVNPIGANPLPTNAADQAEFENGTLIDQLGNEYHINAIFNDTVSDRVIIRLSQEVGQAQPVLPLAGSGSTSPYYLKKQDVYYGNDTTGLPTGKYHWHIANATWDTTNGFVHESSVEDLRTNVVEQDQFEALLNAKLESTITNGGAIGLAIDGQTLSWSADFHIVNPAGGAQVIPSNTAVILDGGSVIYTTNLLATTPVTLGLGNEIVNVTSLSGGGTTLNLASVDLSTVSVGNVIAAPTTSSALGTVNVSLNTITITGHGYKNGDIITFTSTGTLPAPLSANTVYYVVNTTTNTFQVTSQLVGTPVTLTTTGTGTHTAYTKYTQATSITAIDDVSDILTVASAISSTGPAVIFKDSYAAGTAPRSSSTYTLAVRSTGQVVVGNRLELAAGTSNVIYDERIMYPSGLAVGTVITLPANSRFIGRDKYYDVNNRSLQIYVNELFKLQSPDGSTGDWVVNDNHSIKFLYDLPPNTEVHFRDTSLPAGPLGSATGNVVVVPLQQAYNAGSTITTTLGAPVTINGQSGDILLKVEGNASIDGIIDPTGVVLTGQSANPLPSGTAGVWVNTSNELIHQTPSTANNLTSQISTLNGQVADILSGASIPLDPSGAITLTGSGLAVSVDGSTIDIGGGGLEVVTGGIGSTQLAIGAVTLEKLDTITDGVTLDQSAPGGALEIKAGGVGTTQLANSSVTAGKLGAVTDGITLDQSGTGSTLEVKAGGISNSHVSATAGIAYSKLSLSNSIQSGDLTSGSVTTSKLGTVTDGITLDQSGTGGTLEVKAAGISSTQLASSSVTTAKLATITDGVTLDQSGAGSTLEVKTGGIGTSQLAANAVTVAKLGTITDGVTLDQSGSGSTLEIKAGGVGSTQLGSGAVTAAKLGTVTDGVTLDQSGTGSTIEIKAGGVGTTQLAATSVTAAKLGTITDGVTLDQSGTGSTLEIKTGGVGATQLASQAVTAAKIATGAVDGSTITGGNGTALSVAKAPLLATSLTTGVSLTANNSYLVRFALSGDTTAGSLYLADPTSAATNNKYAAIGITGSTSTISVGNPTSVVSHGTYTLLSSDTDANTGLAFTSAQVGLPVYLWPNGKFSTTPPSTSGYAVYRVGVLATTTTIWMGMYQLNGIV